MREKEITGNITGTLQENGPIIAHGRRIYPYPDRLLIKVDRLQYRRIKKHFSDFAWSKQMCVHTTKIPCFTRDVGHKVQFIIQVWLDKLDDPADFESLASVEVRYKLRRYCGKHGSPAVRAGLLSIDEY